MNEHSFLFIVVQILKQGCIQIVYKKVKYKSYLNFLFQLRVNYTLKYVINTILLVVLKPVE